MATSAPKPASKTAPAPEATEEAPPVKKSNKKLLLIIIAAVVLAGGGGAAWFFMGRTPAPAADSKKEVKQEPAKPPVFLTMDPFTVNLQQETGEQFLQVSFTLQVEDEKEVEELKLYMPLMRSRLLLLLSGKKASEISTVEGKKKLSEEIIAQLKIPFVPHGEPQKVSGVFFTSFVIQ